MLALMSEVGDLTAHIHCFTKCLERVRGGSERLLVRLALFQSGRNQVMFCCPELGFQTSSPKGRPAWITYRRIFGKLALGMGRPHYVLHASSVADSKGRALLVSGASGSGKTSVLLALLQRGYQYAGDDYAVVGLDDGRIRALPLGVTINEKTLSAFPELDAIRSDVCRSESPGVCQWTVNPSDIFPTVSAFSELHIQGVFFLNPCFGSPSRVAPCACDEALWRLQNEEMVPPSLGHSGQRQRFKGALLERRIKLARRLVQEVSFFNVANGDVQRTADLIAERV